MQVVCISRGTFSGGKELAEKLADKLGYNCLSREELIEAATKEGIQVGKLEVAMMKPWTFNEKLAIEREHYLAFTTAYLCDRAIEGRLVYHGRTGHLLLPGVSHVMRVRVIADKEYRIKAAMQRLGITREKAQKYIEDVEEDIRRWVQSMYGISWEDASHYDVIVNLAQMSADNAASALVPMAQLPNFQMTPASYQTMEDLRLSAKARLMLARDERTASVSFKVKASKGVVTVTYLPHDSKVAEFIPVILSRLEGVQEIRATMATTNILWIQEKFDSQSETFKNVVEIANKWNAAVELIALSPGNGENNKKEGDVSVVPTMNISMANNEYIGGIEDDVPSEEACDEGGIKKTLEELAKLGRAGGGKTVCGPSDNILNSIERNFTYSLVVVGDIGMSKGDAVRKRLTRELVSLLGEKIKAPVVSVEELKKQYLFTWRDTIRMAVFSILVAVMFFVVFKYQEPILSFLSGGESWKSKSLTALAVFCFAPVVAYFYGSVTKMFLKLIRME